MDNTTQRAAPFWPVVLACAAMMAATTGIRLSLGLFLRPIAATGIGVAWISLVLAVGQFFWGAVQPLFGMLAEASAHGGYCCRAGSCSGLDWR